MGGVYANADGWWVFCSCAGSAYWLSPAAFHWDRQRLGGWEGWSAGANSQGGSSALSPPCSIQHTPAAPITPLPPSRYSTAKGQGALILAKVDFWNTANGFVS